MARVAVVGADDHVAVVVFIRRCRCGQHHHSERQIIIQDVAVLHLVPSRCSSPYGITIATDQASQ